MGFDERKKRVKEIRRNDIIEAAEKVIFANGYDNSSMDDIARAAEFSKRTLYVYFSSKEQIYFAIMVKGYRLLLDKLDYASVTWSSVDALERIRQIGMILHSFSLAHAEYFKAIMEYENGERDFVYSMSDNDMKECYALGEQLFEYLIHVIKDGIEQGTINKDLDVDKTALVLWSSIVGVFSMASKKAKYLIQYHATSPEELVEDAFSFLIRALQI